MAGLVSFRNIEHCRLMNAFCISVVNNNSKKKGPLIRILGTLIPFTSKKKRERELAKLTVRAEMVAAITTMTNATAHQYFSHTASHKNVPTTTTILYCLKNDSSLSQRHSGSLPSSILSCHTHKQYRRALFNFCFLGRGQEGQGNKDKGLSLRLWDQEIEWCSRQRHQSRFVRPL